MALPLHLAALHSSASLDKIMLELLEQQTRMLWQHREALGMPLELFYRQVLDHLGQLQAFLESSLLPGERVKLCDLSSRTLLLAGVVLYDMGIYPAARQAYRRR